MKKYFESQLENIKPLIEDDIKKLKGKSYYSEYKEGDVIGVFLEQSVVVKESTDDITKIKMELRMVVEREFDKLKSDFKFIRMAKQYPVLERIIPLKE